MMTPLLRPSEAAPGLYLVMVFVLLAAWAATAGRSRRRHALAGALAVPILLMATSGLTYVVSPTKDVVARGRDFASSLKFEDNVTEPTAANTGCRTSTGSMVLVSGDTTFSTAGQTVSNRIFEGYVSVSAPNVLFSDCIFRGPAVDATAARGLVSVFSANATTAALQNSDTPSIQFRFCTFRTQAPTQYMNALQGYAFDCYRCDLSGCVDSFSITNPNLAVGVAGKVTVRIRCNYTHDLYYQSPASSQAGDLQTHNDVIQWNNGSGIEFTGNACWAYADPTISSPSGPPNIAGKIPNNSGKGNGQNILAIIQVTPNNGPVSDLLVSKNWFYGATAKVQISQKSRGAIPRIVISDNRFGDDGTQDNATTIDLSTLTLNISTWTGNYWHVGPRAGQAIPATRSNTGFYARADT